MMIKVNYTVIAGTTMMTGYRSENKTYILRKLIKMANRTPVDRYHTRTCLILDR